VVREPVGDDTSVPPLPPDRLCTLVVERFAWSGYRDDVTVLVAELLAEPPAPPRLRLPAHPDSLSTARAAVGEWLSGLGLSPTQAGLVQHALGEAMANAVEHAYGAGRSGEFTVGADLGDEGLLRLTVTDQGRWRPAPADPQNRGRGLLLMRGLADRVEVTPGDLGTTVTITQRLRRPVEVGTATGLLPLDLSHAYAGEVPFEVSAQGETLMVRGAIDTATVDRLEMAVRTAGRGGAVPVTLDLTGVTLLASVGGRLLHRLDTAADPAGLRLVAPAGGPVRQVLALTGLAHLLA
jgi:anti-sigma regulatory factor (Ser/Thr protein kinase)/anti-anti-sigma regulatory factor